MSNVEYTGLVDSLEKERNELGEKKSKLISFLKSDKFKSLSEYHQHLLGKQLDYMDLYQDVLWLRIEDIKGTNEREVAYEKHLNK